jgi:hypothetical protein
MGCYLDSPLHPWRAQPKYYRYYGDYNTVTDIARIKKAMKGG